VKDSRQARAVEALVGKRAEILSVADLEANFANLIASECDAICERVDSDDLALGTDLRGNPLGQSSGAATHVEHARAALQSHALEQAFAGLETASRLSGHSGHVLVEGRLGSREVDRSKPHQAEHRANNEPRGNPRRR
jgi:hypothetical protein